jgi:hypothetical protein
VSRSVRAGLVYFAIVFAAGFALGTLRVLVVVPHIGELPAVLAELPILLGVSWVACGYAIRRYDVSAAFEARGAMGLVAFGVLMAVEYLMANVGFGRSLAEHLSRYAEPAQALGLAGQMAFGAMPLFRR